MSTTNFQKKQIAREVNKVIQNGFSIDTSDDQKALKDQPYFWDDLNTLKDELGSSIIEFIGQVNAIITNPEVIQNLGDRKEHFEKLLSTCRDVLKDRKKAAKLLPVKTGFFFGGTEYDKYYFGAVEDTVEILENVLEEIKKDEEMYNYEYFYQSSW